MAAAPRWVVDLQEAGDCRGATAMVAGDAVAGVAGDAAAGVAGDAAAWLKGEAATGGGTAAQVCSCGSRRLEKEVSVELFFCTELFRDTFYRITFRIECRCTEYYSIHDDRIV
jgi:hypothetical protein